MDLLGNWSNFFPQMTGQQIDQSVSTAEMGDLIEFVNPWLGLSLWAVYAGDGHVIHFGVGDEDVTQKACRSFLQLMIPKSKGNRVLKKTRICKQRLADVRSLAGTRIRVNNSKHNLAASPQEIMTVRCEIFLEQEFKYDMVNFNSEHFATFVRYGHALSSQEPSCDLTSKAMHSFLGVF
ncbi:phospholipase A and acyltransferase 4 isoform X2 [Kryptolebias marmoratus]|uniref:phospholipase A and acyltransferase 4 isoform X2 n=1 Tax=Kryptolebias marmoratus TaxID=37003 RepID=UPI0007F90966|nr:phospholipase A and acyltransferase 4 isoform X2 [Kryptolebias marmoratus]